MVTSFKILKVTDWFGILIHDFSKIIYDNEHENYNDLPNSDLHLFHNDGIENIFGTIFVVEFSRIYY